MAAQALPPLEMTERHYTLLERHTRKRNTGNHEVKRIKILLKASTGQSNYSISKELSIRVETVRTWRARWAACYEQLSIFEKGKSGEGVSDLELLKRMLAILTDHPRSGKPPRITLSQKQQIVAMACRKPSEYGLPMTRWTHETLAQVAKAEKIVKSISPRYVGEILKK